MLATVRARDFQALEKGLCQLTLAEGCEVAIELVKIEEKPQAAIPFSDPDTRIPFSLLFKTPLEHAFIADYCHLHHPTLGILENVSINRILPLNPNDQTAWYQIVFA
ncbi:MAG: hypothetical protein WAX77_14225 [Methylococcaceae bacterium]